MTISTSPIANRPLSLGWTLKFLATALTAVALIFASTLCLLDIDPSIHLGTYAGWNTSFVTTPFSTGILLQHEVESDKDQSHWTHNWNLLGLVYTDGVVAEYSLMQLAHQRAIRAAALPTWLIFGIAILWLVKLLKCLRHPA